MRALVKYAYQDEAVEVREVPEPTITADEVLLEVRAVGVCGSDIHLWREHQSWPIKMPLVLGHEFAGVIAEVGDRVSGWQCGERVACETAASVCGACVYCLSGNYNLCPHRKGYGAQVDGAMTRWVAARPQILHRIPENVSFEHAALAEPVCVAYNALVEKTGGPAAGGSRGHPGRRGDRHDGDSDRAGSRCGNSRGSRNRHRRPAAGDCPATRRALCGPHRRG